LQQQLGWGLAADVRGSSGLDVHGLGPLMPAVKDRSKQSTGSGLCRIVAGLWRSEQERQSMARRRGLWMSTGWVDVDFDLFFLSFFFSFSILACCSFLLQSLIFCFFFYFSSLSLFCTSL
jgi:hypothetical protein